MRMILKALLDHPQTHIIWLLSLQKAPTALMNLMLLIVSPQLDNEDLEQIDQDELEEMDLKWQVAMLSMRVKRFYKKTRRKLEFNGIEPVGFEKTKVECFNFHRRGHFARDCRTARNPGNRGRDAGNAGYKGRDKEEATDFALMAFTLNPSSSSSSNFEVQSCSKQCVQSYEQLKNLFDEQRKKLRKANLEIIGYQYGLESIEGQLHVHQQNKVIYEEKIGVLEYDVKDKSNLLKYTQKQLDEALREKEDLKAKLEKFESSSKNLTKLLDSQISAKVKTGLGYDSQFNEKEVLDVKEEEVTETMFDNRSNRMAKKSVLPSNVRKGTGHRESRPVWNNVQRINHQNKFSPTAVFTRFGRIPISDAKPKATASTSAAKPVNTARPKQSVNFSNSRISVVKGNKVTDVKASTGCVWRPRVNEIDQISKDNRWICTLVDYGHPHQALKNKGIVNSGCSRHMIGNKAYLADFKEINDGGFVAFGSSRGKITGNDKIRTKKLDFDDVYFVNELKFNLFPVSQMRDKKNSVLFIETKCLVLSSNFKLLDEIQVLLRVPKQSNMALVTKHHNKTPYELLNGRSPRLDFMRPFGCHVTILNTLDPLGKFEGKADEGFLVGYFVTSKAFRVFNTKTRKVKENLHVRDALDRLMSQEKEASDASDSFRKEFEQGCMDQRGAAKAGSTNSFNSVSNPVNAANDSLIPDLEDIAELRSTVDLPYGKKAIGTKWVYKNKKDERGIVVRNKSRLVAQGHKQEEGIDYDEVFAHVARIEAIRIFLAFASFMRFIVYQMDVKSAFLYGKIEEEVYVSQSPGFLDPHFPNKVYKTKNYRQDFIKKDKDDIMLVQVYVDDIIFRSTKKSLCDEFEALMHKRFQMSSMGEITYFLRLQYINRDSKAISQKMRKLQIFQVTQKLSHLYVVKRIFRYLKGQHKLGLWYPRDSSFDLEAYLDSDYARANLDMKSITGGCQFLGRRLISW
nr:hypothetical protein [Tanacetum cinerariifolium]